MAFPALTLRVRVFLFFALLIVAIPVVTGTALWLAHSTDSAQGTRLLGTYVGVGAVFLILLTLFIWQLFDRHIASALQSLARQMQTALHAELPQLPDSETLRYLGPVGPAALELTSALHESRCEQAAAQASAAGTLEARQMAAILDNLDTGVLVLNLAHQILLYNQQALAMLTLQADADSDAPSPAQPMQRPGLARPVNELITGDALQHAVERLLSRATSEPHSTPLILSPRGKARLLQGTVGLVRDLQDKPTGYVVVFDDVTERLALANEKEQLAHFALHGARRPIERLMASVQAGMIDDHLAPPVNELREHLDAVAQRYTSIQGSEWPMADYLSGDLVNIAITGLKLSDHGVDSEHKIALNGESVWLHGNTYLLEALLTKLLHDLRERAVDSAVAITTLVSADTAQLQLDWTGRAMTEQDLNDFIDSTLPDDPTRVTVRQVLVHHGTGIDLHPLDNGRHALNMTLGACATTIVPPESTTDTADTSVSSPAIAQARSQALPARPEFYDFDLFDRIVEPELQNRLLTDIDYVVFDTETTGLNPSGGDEMISIAGVRIVNGRVLSSECFNELINPGRRVPERSIVFHGITDDMLIDKPGIETVLPRFARFVGHSVLVAHNAAFDMKFLERKSEQCKLSFSNPVLDTVLLSAWLHDHTHKHTLDDLAMRCGVTIHERHSALGDAVATAQVFTRLLKLLAARDVQTLAQAISVSDRMTHIKRHQKAY